MCVSSAAAISENEAENEVPTEDEFTELLTAEMPSNEFGGLYYEGDTLVVNVVASQKTASLRLQLAQKAPEDVDVEYRTVTYTLSELERIKDFLTGHMSDYSIMMLDANEITNQVDISLKDYSDDNIESMDIEEKSIVKYRDLDPVLEYGATAYDDQYLYLTNAIRYMDYQGTVPAEGRGIMVYDFHGNLQQFIPMTQEVGNAMFLLSTPDYVFFYDDSTHSCHPAWYIEKSAIASNSAKMLPVE